MSLLRTKVQYLHLRLISVSFLWVYCLSLFLTFAPTGAGQQSPAVPVDVPVITIDGLCDSPPASDTTVSDCRTVITRAQFEAMASALQPNMTAQTKRQLAESYSRMLVMARKAHEMGLDQVTEFEVKIRFARLQVLSQLLSRTLQDRAGGNSTAFKQAMEAINNSTTRTLNPNYFGASTPSTSPRENQGMSPPPQTQTVQGQPPPLSGASSVELKEGQTPAEVEKMLGKPSDSVTLKGSFIYIYPTVKVIFENGKLVDVQYQQK